MRDMVAQCDSNMTELQQLQVRPQVPPGGWGPGSPGGILLHSGCAGLVTRTALQAMPFTSPSCIEGL
jgi:hypothetical protein